jgi:hypothetical protein
LIFGRKAVVTKLSSTLHTPEVEIVAISHGADGLEVTGQCENAKLALLDGSVKDLDRTFQYIEESLGIPTMLIVDGGKTDWHRFESLDPVGYLPDMAPNTELVAQLRAVEGRVYSG